MKTITILPLALLFLSAGAVKSQAPVTGSLVSSLESLAKGNKDVIAKQLKTLEFLDKLDLDSQQLKIFGKRG